MEQHLKTKTEEKTKLIETKALGKVEVSTQNIITFKEGILAFHDLKYYIVLDTPKKTSFKYLQSMDNPFIAFVVIKPEDFSIQYKPLVSSEVLSSIKLNSLQNEYSIYCIITVPNNQPEKMTINLQGPIIINNNLKLAGQFISEDPHHNVRAPFVELIESFNTNGS